MGERDVLTKEELTIREDLRLETGTGILPHATRRAGSIIDRLVSEVERLRARNEALEQVAKVAGLAASAVRSLMSDSRGVDGYHRNGDIAGWGELERGGRFECIAEFNALEDALAEPGEGGATSERQRGVAGDRCEAGNNCGRPGCPECQA